MLMADVQHDFSRTKVTTLAAIDVNVVEATFASMESDARSSLNEEGFGEESLRLQRSIDVRYAGQEHSVTIQLPALDERFTSQIEQAFSVLHERQYGHVMGDPIEITTLRLRATGWVEKPGFPLAEKRTSGHPQLHGTRLVYVDADHPSVQYDLYVREELLAGDEIFGPAVIAEHTATTVIHSDDVIRVGEFGELVITKAASREEVSA
jgi:N-methylhydantoinase A